jgi:hypothetical protein
VVVGSVVVVVGGSVVVVVVDGEGTEGVGEQFDNKTAFRDQHVLLLLSSHVKVLSFQ